MNLAFYEALDRIPLGVAVTIEFAGPVGVAVALSRRPLDLVWVRLAIGGILILADPFGAGGIDPVGLLFVGVAAIAWAVYILVAARAARRFEGLTGLAMASAVAALVPLVPGIVSAGTDLLVPEMLALGAAVALLSSVIPYSLETTALRRIPPRVFGVLMSLEPAVAALAGFLVLDQRLGARDLLAIGLVIAASVGSPARRRHWRPRPEGILRRPCSRSTRPTCSRSRGSCSCRCSSWRCSTRPTTATCWRRSPSRSRR
jgi:inner membrane transporter RhtA